MGAQMLAALGEARAGDLATLLASADAAALVSAIRAASDEEIQACTATAEREQALVVGLLTRVGELAIPGQAGPDARPRALGACPAVRGAPWTCTTAPSAGRRTWSSPGPRGELLRLVAGRLDVAVAYLGDQIRFHGASDLALALASLFAVDGTAPVMGTPVDVRDIDPVDVSRVLTGVPADHLRSVLASDFRPVVLDEIFARMPSFLNGRKAAGVQVTVGFCLTGRPDGEVDRYVLRLSDGQATVLAGEAAGAVPPEDCQASVTCEAADFLRLVTGHLSAVSGLLRGQAAGQRRQGWRRCGRTPRSTYRGRWRDERGPDDRTQRPGQPHRPVQGGGGHHR
ncbi:hypothetical protein G5V59_05600 [Nocardioides sp. W3-2-3]|uniref:hypothetical protein n=1 Tax=Nocardioides convexus TaxID=2712224 RepID=UPI00241852C2|nr:hypothetical protein [Nocardioides convexus]NGZ99910.1 hypothetical protein [Nocardioides convexus]